MLNSRIMEQYNTTGVLANIGSVISFIWQEFTKKNISYFVSCPSFTVVLIPWRTKYFKNCIVKLTIF